MCRISDKLKLCTCTTQDVTKQENYWILHQFIKDREHIIIGMMQVHMNITDFDIENNKSIEKQLNQPGIFDQDFKLKNSDYLEMHFNNVPGKHLISYGFHYNNGKWRGERHFYTDGGDYYHKEYSKGIIENASH
ncbi:MAG: hypothetical protein JWN78_1202 [Bacteroidota bacterium]|nr:hypothetical protein [Bacteroidota bacterium]